MNKIVVIVGPTATGKTSLAIKLCKIFNGEIISVDSRQAYTEMEIGTGKNIGYKIGGSRLESNEEVPIYLYDVAEPNKQLSAFEFSNIAWQKIKEIWSKGKVPFLVGGSGFYMDVTLGLVKLASVPSDPALRNELSALTSEQLLERLKELNPERAAKIDSKNPYRLLRAVEVEETSRLNNGSNHPKRTEESTIEESETVLRLPVDQNNNLVNVLPFKYLLIGLTAENFQLYKLADARVDDMVKLGLLSEVKQLSEKYGWQAPGLKTLGYREFMPYFTGNTSLNDAIQRLKFNTHSYIRRQKTYFKRNKNIKWFDITFPGFDKQVIKVVKLFLQ